MVTAGPIAHPPVFMKRADIQMTATNLKVDALEVRVSMDLPPGDPYARLLHVDKINT